MRKDPATTAHDLSVADFRARFALGSHQRVVLLDEGWRVIGSVVVPKAHAESASADAPVLSIAETRDKPLLPTMSIKDAMRAFDETESDTLVVVDGMETRRLLGTLKETYATRRHAEEMERAQSL